MNLSRRTLLGGMAAVGTAALSRSVLAIDPFPRTEPGPMKLSLSAYSFRKELTGRDGQKPQMDLFDLVDFCRAHDVPGVELTSYYFPEDFDEAYLHRLSRHCHMSGVSISGGAIRNDYCVPADKLEAELEHTRRWIDAYDVLGAPAIRIFAGRVPKGDTQEAAIERCIKGCQRACDYAAEKGVWLALENHGGITARAEDMLQIVRAVDSPWFGVNFDSGNFRVDDIPAELAKIAPYAVNAQIKVEVYQDGKKVPADLEQLVGVLHEANYGGWVALEYEAAEPALEAVPRTLEQLRKLL